MHTHLPVGRPLGTSKSTCRAGTQAVAEGRWTTTAGEAELRGPLAWEAYEGNGQRFSPRAWGSRVRPLTRHCVRGRADDREDRSR